MNKKEYRTTNLYGYDMDLLEAFENWENTDDVIIDIIESITFDFLDDIDSIAKKAYYKALFNQNLKALIVNWSIRAIKEYSLNIPVENEPFLLDELKYDIEADNTLSEVFEMVAGYHVK